MNDELTFEEEWKQYLEGDDPVRLKQIVCGCMATMDEQETGWTCPDCGQVVVVLRGKAS